MLLSCSGTWSVDGTTGVVSCSDGSGGAGVVETMTPAQVLDVGFIPADAVPVVGEFAVLALILAFGVKMIRRILNA